MGHGFWLLVSNVLADEEDGRRGSGGMRMTCQRGDGWRIRRAKEEGENEREDGEWKGPTFTHHLRQGVTTYKPKLPQ